MGHENPGGRRHVVMRVADRREVGIVYSRSYGFPVRGAHRARPPRGSRRQSAMSVWSLGSARSRPESHARKNQAGPTIWLKNNAAVIGSNSPRRAAARAIARRLPRGANSARACAPPRISSAPFAAEISTRNSALRAGSSRPSPDAHGSAAPRLPARRRISSTAASIGAVRDTARGFAEARAGEFLLRTRRNGRSCRWTLARGCEWPATVAPRSRRGRTPPVPPCQQILARRGQL